MGNRWTDLADHEYFRHRSSLCNHPVLRTLLIPPLIRQDQGVDIWATTVTCKILLFVSFSELEKSTFPFLWMIKLLWKEWQSREWLVVPLHILVLMSCREAKLQLTFLAPIQLQLSPPPHPNPFPWSSVFPMSLFQSSLLYCALWNSDAIVNKFHITSVVPLELNLYIIYIYLYAHTLFFPNGIWIWCQELFHFLMNP